MEYKDGQGTRFPREEIRSMLSESLNQRPAGKAHRRRKPETACRRPWCTPVPPPALSTHSRPPASAASARISAPHASSAECKGPLGSGGAYRTEQ